MLGHKCSGGGASISNSPINVHIHIYAQDEKFINKVIRSIRGITGTRHEAIENTAGISEDDIRRNVYRLLEHR